MTDQPRDPKTDERVRRLLAEARHDEPMPDEVAARMDQVLAGLASEPAARDNVVRLSQRRRRATTLLVAAVAVVATGIGVGDLLRGSGGGSAAGGANADTAAGAPAPERPGTAANGPEAFKSNGGADAGNSTASAPTSSQAYDLAATPVRVRPEHFSHDVVRAQKATRARSTDGRTDAVRGAISCVRPSWGGGRYVPVSYGSTPGVLVFRKPAGDTQVVDLYLCDARTPVRSVTLPRP